ncbi:transposase [Streptomyces aquilus]|uniref:transposase n=1 Tax=Streptomyces aquilus TaxID=2548456 RepID=UPI001416EE2D
MGFARLFHREPGRRGRERHETARLCAFRQGRRTVLGLNEWRGLRTLLTAWITKENLRNLLARACTGADRHQVGHARWKFLTWCANSDIHDVRQLAVTVDRWWPEIEAFIDTGHSNARSEGINRVIKLVARNAFGFRNADNQRLRTRYVTTRRARGHLRTAQLRRPGKGRRFRGDRLHRIRRGRVLPSDRGLVRRHQQPGQGGCAP